MTTIKNYQDASNYLGAKKERPFAHNTRIERVTDGAIHAKYHGHSVAVFVPDGVILSSCGWRTITTKERLNWFMPEGFRLWQEKSVWYISDVSKGWEQARRYVFMDGMSISNDGTVTGAGSADEPNQIKQQVKQIHKFVEGYIKALFEGDVPAPSSRDCFYCHTVTESGESIGGTDHLVSHMEESYYVPSLLMKAAHDGKHFCMVSKDGIARIWQGEKLYEWQRSLVIRDVKAGLTAYLKHEFGIAK